MEIALNNSEGNDLSSGATEWQTQIIFIVIYVFLCTLVALFGIVSNVINLVVFYKQGLDSSINITFFALAISDLCGLLVQQWLDVLMNPWFERIDAPMVPSEFQYMTAGIPRVVFSRITCLITVYITMERCMCTIFPLHIKQMITPRRTALAMCAIHIVTCSTFAPLYFTGSIGWKFSPSRNRTVLGLNLEPGHEQLTQIVYIMLAFMGSALFLAIIIFTAILVRQLGHKRSWRKSTCADKAKSETMSNRDRKTMSMVVLIASILILCYTPSVVLLLATFVEPEFSVCGKYNNLFTSIWGFGYLFETLNSSVNICLYFKMSTKYRETFCALFACNTK